MAHPCSATRAGEMGGSMGEQEREGGRERAQASWPPETRESISARPGHVRNTSYSVTCTAHRTAAWLLGCTPCL